MDISCQILIAEEVKFDPNVNQHSIINVLNKVSVPAFPTVLITHVYFKFLFTNEILLHDCLCEIKISDPSGEIVFGAVLPELSNFRSSEMSPGIDGAIEIRVPVYISGNYEYTIYANNEKIFNYPLYIEEQ